MKRLGWPLGAVSLAALIGAVAALGADQSTTTTYRWVDAQGVVHYSDTPQPGAEQLKIHAAQTYSAPSVSGAANGRGTDPAAESVYRSCAVLRPGADQTFYAPEDVTVSVSLEPQLRTGDQISVTMDGTALRPIDESALRFRVSEPDRGAHSLSVTVRDASGNVVCTSSGVTFYVQRPSRLSPQSPTRGH